MNPITLPTSPETRAALEKAGWVVALHDLYEIWDCNLVQVVLTTGDCRVTDLFQHLSEPGAMMRLLEFATTRGICIPGYRIIPEETAAEYLAARTAFYGRKVDGDPGDTTKGWTRYEDAEETLAVALGGTRLLPPHPSEEGGPSPSPKERQDAAKAEIVGLVEAAAQGYDVDKMTRELDAFFREPDEAAEPREEETP